MNIKRSFVWRHETKYWAIYPISILEPFLEHLEEVDFEDWEDLAYFDYRYIPRGIEPKCYLLRGGNNRFGFGFNYILIMICQGKIAFSVTTMGIFEDCEKAFQKRARTYAKKRVIDFLTVREVLYLNE